MKKLLLILSVFLLFAHAQGQSVIRAQSNARAMVSGACVGTQNLVKYSEQLDNAYWGKSNGSITATNVENDLEGNATMDEYTNTNAICNLRVYNEGDNITTVGGVTYRFSFDVKRGTLETMYYSVYDWTNGGDIIASTNYYNSTSSSVSRVSFEFTTPAGCTNTAVYLLRNEGGTTGTAYFGRVQVETNGSCYVETTDTIITP